MYRNSNVESSKLTQSQSAPQGNTSTFEQPSRPVMVDLRSDTVTKPTPEMRRAMAEAEVGDDVYGEDPTVNRLEQAAAAALGREAAIFVPTGTMGNQIAIKIHTQPGQEIICEERAHIFNWEMATLASFSGCLVRPVPADAGVLTWDHVRKVVSPKIYYRAQTGLIVLENTHNMAGGTVSPIAAMDEVCANARALGIKTHLDGARVFNAATSLGRPVAEVTKSFDSVMFCLSKGLGAPVGSMLVGSKSFIEQARIHRKSLGGGMRQAGILAAAGLIALQQMTLRLQEDHDNARYMAEALDQMSGVNVDLASVQTNILIFEVTKTGTTALDVTKKLAEQNILASGISAQQVRLVTHMDVDRAACARAVAALRTIFD
ncbi:MAG TPA: low-specificity L-threonine aldolase [Terriglobales bacterium]|nr:low-specificity L-threonine aldolase [Terriglobales bacterium]